MFLPLLMLVATFLTATLFSLLGAYIVGASGAVLGMILGLFVCFVLMSRQVGS